MDQQGSLYCDCRLVDNQLRLQTATWVGTYSKMESNLDQ